MGPRVYCGTARWQNAVSQWGGDNDAEDVKDDALAGVQRNAPGVPRLLINLPNILGLRGLRKHDML